MSNKYDLSEFRKKELSELAEFIAEDTFPDGNVIQPEIIAEKNEISYCCGSYENYFDGLLEYLDKSFHIYLNIDRLKHQFTPRARFTFAHELGHYFIDEHRNALKFNLVKSHPSFIDFSSDNEAELEADYFAASLLLPTGRILKDISGRKFEFNIIEELRSKYQTSLTATLLKFIAIGSQPMMIVVSQKERIKWFKYSSDFPFKFINAKPGFKVPPLTSAGEYHYENKKNIDSDELVYAEDWFSINYDEDRRREFWERCIYADSVGFVISVLWEK